MAYVIPDMTGTTLPVSGTNPYGYVVDAPNGTVVDKIMVADVLVLMQKMMADGSVTPNSLPDNTTNGFQLFEALQRCICPLLYFTTAASVQIVSVPGGVQGLLLSPNTIYEFNVSSGSFAGLNVCTFGDDAPVGAKCYFYVEPSSTDFLITLNSTAATGLPIIVQDGVLTVDTAFTPIYGKTYLIVRRTNVWEIVA